MAERAACSPAPAAALVGGSDGGRSGRGGDLGRISKPPRLGQIRAHSSVSTAWRATCFRHHLKQMFSLDLAPWYFPFMRSVYKRWVAWLGPQALKTCPGCPALRWRLEAAPCLVTVWQPEGRWRGLMPRTGKQGGRPAAGALTAHRQKRVLCRVSEGASPPSGRPGPGQLGR